MKIKPLHNQLVVERVENLKQLPSGIVIPESSKEKSNQAKVLAVGPGKIDKDGKLIPIDIKVGDTVIFGSWAGQLVKVDNVEYLMLKDDDIFAVLEE